MRLFISEFSRRVLLNNWKTLNLRKGIHLLTFVIVDIIDKYFGKYISNRMHIIRILYIYIYIYETINIHLRYNYLEFVTQF